MPVGKPSSQEIIEQRITGFALDTCILQSAGFHFKSGPLKLLHRQLPPWMRLYLPEVLVNESVAHQVDSLEKYTTAISSAVQSISRAGFEIDGLKRALDAASFSTRPKLEFRNRIDDFVKVNRGEVVPLATGLTKKMFEMYFEGKAPFGASKDRKSEFPDAAVLLTLEAVAKRKATKLIAVSADRAWHDYAKDSAAIFCVNSLDELTGMFVSSSPEATAIEIRLGNLLSQDNNRLQTQIECVLKDRIGELGWRADGYAGFSARVEPEVVDVDIEYFEVDVNGMGLWMSPEDESMCIVEVELNVNATFQVAGNFYVVDPIDRDEINVGSGTSFTQTDVIVTAFLTLGGSLQKGDPKDWDISIELEDVDWVIDVGEMELDRGEDYLD
jgi:hypothetical protein